MMTFSTVAVVTATSVDPSAAMQRAASLVAPSGRLLLVDGLPELTVLARAVLPARLEALYVRERDQRRRHREADPRCAGRRGPPAVGNR